MHDPYIQKVIPYAEFATNCHNIDSISKGLLGIIKDRETIAPFVVTDESWALINSVIRTFNQCSPLTYLNWAYNVLTKNESNYNMNSAMRTRVILCQTHFFKNVAIKSKEIVKTDKKKFNLFLYAFTVLQNSITIREFEKNLEYLFDIFCRKNKSEKTILALTTINAKVSERNLDIFKIHDADILNLNDHKRKNVFVMHDDDKDVIKKSEFTEHFKSLINSFNDSVFPCLFEENAFYCPSLFDIIRVKLHIMPLWSGVMIRQGIRVIDRYLYSESRLREKTRFDNNPGEGYFCILKTKILLDEVKVLPSEVVPKIYNYTKSVYLEFYSSNSKEKLKERREKKPSAQVIERWKKQKGQYYKNSCLKYIKENLDIESELYDLKKKENIRRRCSKGKIFLKKINV